MVSRMSRTFVIAEAGVNHNGCESTALQLVDIAAECGADAIKFQTFTADRLVVKGTSKVSYQLSGTQTGDQHSMLSALQLTKDTHLRLYERCASCGIEFMSTPFDENAVDFLVSLGMKRIKIPSGEITNHPFLAYLASFDLPLILSTGMSTLNEIAEATSVITNARKAAGHNRPIHQILTILHCTSNYPALLHDVHLSAMQTIAKTLDLPVGYSDHTATLSVSTAAVALGASVIEKHFTIDKKMAGPDHKASLEPWELAAMIKQIREVEVALGYPDKKPTDSELPVRDLVRRSIISRRDLLAGQVLGHDDICFLRPGFGIPPSKLDSILGRTLKRSINSGTFLEWSDLS